jgi:hypothetical protein
VRTIPRRLDQPAHANRFYGSAVCCFSCNALLYASLSLA